MPRTGRPFGSTCALCGVSARRERLIALRIALHGSQRALVGALAVAGIKVTPQAISGWERGEYHPEESKLPAIARALRVRTRDLEAWLWPNWGHNRQVELPTLRRRPRGEQVAHLAPRTAPASTPAAA
jgi:transcriptional regulator with XRE-family HTH domain